eukprot:1328303-Ditylum_brightwellii.AAC.1
MKYYKTVGCRVMVSITVNKTMIKSFTNQWEGLKDQKQQAQPKVPKITGKLPAMQWTDVFDDFLHMKIGEELVAQVSHMHPLYCKDDAAVYYCLVEPDRGTQYSLSLKPSQQVKNGRGLWSLLHNTLLEPLNCKQNYP